MSQLTSHRLPALMQKELNQFRRDPKIVMSLIIPPILQILLFGFVLNSKIEHLRLGVLEEARTPQSRELIANLGQSVSFRLTRSYLDPAQLSDAITDGTVQAGIIIPYDFTRNLQRGRPAEVQFLLNGMDANTATIARTYAQGIIGSYSAGLPAGGLHARFSQIAATDVGRRGAVALQPSFLYNPGLLGSWFTVTGVLGLLCILNGSLVASDTMVRERERGTIEQLLMSPASTFEIIVAKLAPIFGLLCIMTASIMAIGRLVFLVPLLGSFMLVYFASMLCVLGGMGIGTFLASFSKTTFQANLSSFFVNPPLSALSGAITPVEAMPAWLRPLTELNPIHHFGVIARACMLKGSDMETLWPNFVALGAIAVEIGRAHV